MLVGAIAVMGLGLFLGSCSKKNEPFNGCVCTVMGLPVNFTADDVKNAGYDNCSDFSKATATDCKDR